MPELTFRLDGMTLTVEGSLADLSDLQGIIDAALIAGEVEAPTVASGFRLNERMVSGPRCKIKVKVR